MSHSELEIKEGAFIVSDAHYSTLRPQLLSFMQAIRSKKLLPTQLILMGDSFDALFGGVERTYEINSEIIELLNELALEMEVVCLEGNHDFNLKNVFENVKVSPIKEQPIACTYKEKKVLLAHGDFDGGFTYLTFTAIIRNPIVLRLLKSLDNATSHWVLKKLDAYLSKKEDCKKIENFKERAFKRINSTYECDYFIEGHFHQNETFEFPNLTYVNLGAFACNQRYFIVKSIQDKELLEENIFSKGI